MITDCLERQKLWLTVENRIASVWPASIGSRASRPQDPKVLAFNLVMGRENPLVLIERLARNG